MAAAVSVALTVGACQKETGPAPAYGGPPMNDSMRQVTPTPNAAADAGAVSPTPPPPTPTGTPTGSARTTPSAPDLRTAPAYGAPPPHLTAPPPPPPKP